MFGPLAQRDVAGDARPVARLVVRRRCRRSRSASFDTTVTGPAQSIFLIELSLASPATSCGSARLASGLRLGAVLLIVDGHDRAADRAVALNRDDVAGEHGAALAVEHVEAVGVDLDRLLAVGPKAAERRGASFVFLRGAAAGAAAARAVWARAGPPKSSARGQGGGEAIRGMSCLMGASSSVQPVRSDAGGLRGSRAGLGPAWRSPLALSSTV